MWTEVLYQHSTENVNSKLQSFFRSSVDPSYVLCEESDESMMEDYTATIRSLFPARLPMCSSPINFSAWCYCLVRLVYQCYKPYERCYMNKFHNRNRYPSRRVLWSSRLNNADLVLVPVTCSFQIQGLRKSSFSSLKSSSWILAKFTAASRNAAGSTWE